MRSLVLIVNGGLCNRLRALVTAKEWSANNDRRFRVVWPVDERFEARFSDLFEDPMHSMPWFSAKVLARLSGGYALPEAVSSLERRRVIVVNTGDVFHGEPNVPIPQGPLLRRLRPTNEILERIRTNAGWTRPAVGVMIRANATAHRNTLDVSPPSWFFERMSHIRSTDPDVEFFLSTDSPSVSAEVHDRFQNVFELPDKSEYNTAAGVQDAVCDLYLLAGTTYILGSHWSSFSLAARELSGHGGYETAVEPPQEPWASRRHKLTTPPILDSGSGTLR